MPRKTREIVYSYETVTEALESLYRRGYANNFNIKDSALECKNLNLVLKPEDFEIVEFYRFEGETNPGDEEIVYAIESKDGVKGTLVSAFGIYADEVSDEVLKKLKIER
ncbi:MAG: phosphoribosylpyrophosphate synthetase [Chlorobi bacterium]|nr:phosphoribosylpyrophosphate synthetase [Chlorobiota bacterium]MCI0716711.1 phosphoribosylpyrophosphate synthetase [Chlorobiota bacterium]